ncbi:MAG: hypothetical protein LBF91_01520 [Azoarcus sp.]|jgi:hypothetical protein|nr:hypothetical protein [Azoarcus sp.]
MAKQWIKSCPGFLIAVILAGCGSMGAQFASIGEVSESEPQARLRVLGGGGFVRGVPDSNCLDWSKPGAGTIIGGLVGSSGFRGRSLDMPNPERREGKPFAEIHVAAGKPFALAFMTGPEARYSCALSGVLVLDEGQDYEAEARMSDEEVRVGLSFVPTCVLSLKRLTPEGTWEPQPIRQVLLCRRRK